MPPHRVGVGAAAALTHIAALLLISSGSPRVSLATALWLLSLGLAIVAFLPIRWPAASLPGSRARTGSLSAAAEADGSTSVAPVDVLMVLSGAVVAGFGQWLLVSATTGGPPPMEGVLALLLGAGLFAYGVGRGGRPTALDGAAPLIVHPRTIFAGPAAVLGAGLGLLLGLVLLTRLLGGRTATGDVLLWLGVLAGFGAPFVLKAGRPRLTLPRQRWADLLLPGLLAGFFVALNARDLDHWYFAAIGDEYPFFQWGREILANGIPRPFSQAGVYDTHPVLNSVYQAMVMALFGQDHVGWKLSSVLSVALAVPAVYLLGLLLANRTVGVLATVLFVSSHYLFAFAHVGSNNAHGLAPAAWALALFVRAEQRRSPLLHYAAGLAAGLGFYTFFAARTIVAVLGLFVLTQRQRGRHLVGLWPFALGFGLVVAPIVLTSRFELVTRMVAQVPGGYSSDVTGPIGSRLAANLWMNALAFNYSAAIGHYVSGSLLDPVSGVLAVLGVAVALRCADAGPYRLLLLWVAVALLATGLLSPYPQVAITRLFFCVPPLVLLAGLAAWHVWQAVSAPLPSSAARLLAPTLVGVLGLVVLGLNVHRFWYESPAKIHLNQEAVGIGALRSETCGDDLRRAIVVARTNGGVLRAALVSYDPGGPLPRFVGHDGLPQGQPLDVGTARCVVFVYPDDEPERRALAELSRAHPSGRVLRFTDPAGKGRVAIFTLAEPR